MFMLRGPSLVGGIVQMSTLPGSTPVFMFSGPSLVGGIVQESRTEVICRNQG